jgi:hypothetical protein
MARRSARVFADEYQPSQEQARRDGGHVPDIRERGAKQTEKSRSRGSSCSSLSLMNFEMDVYAEVASNDSSRDGETLLCSTLYFASNDWLPRHSKP